jgi:hypothetical protein
MWQQPARFAHNGIFWILLAALPQVVLWFSSLVMGLHQRTILSNVVVSSMLFCHSRPNPFVISVLGWWRAGKTMHAGCTVSANKQTYVMVQEAMVQEANICYGSGSGTTFGARYWHRKTSSKGRCLLKHELRICTCSWVSLYVRHQA